MVQNGQTIVYVEKGVYWFLLQTSFWIWNEYGCIRWQLWKSHIWMDGPATWGGPGRATCSAFATFIQPWFMLYIIQVNRTRPKNKLKVITFLFSATYFFSLKNLLFLGTLYSFLEELSFISSGIYFSFPGNLLSFLGNLLSLIGNLLFFSRELTFLFSGTYFRF